MNIIGTVSFQSSYYEHSSKRLLVQGWFLAKEGYDAVKVNGKRAKTGVERPDVYNRFPEYNMRNSGFVFDTIIQSDDYSRSDYVPAKVEVIKDEKIIFSKIYEVQIKQEIQTNKVEKILLTNNIKKNVSFAFETDIPLFNLKYIIRNTEDSNAPHVGATARAGIAVLYKKRGEHNWMPVDTYSRTNDIPVNLTHMLGVGESYSVLIYTPIEAVVEKMWVVIDKNYKFQIIPLNEQFIWLGGVHTYGLGVSAASMKFSNMIQRRFASSGETYACIGSTYLREIYKELSEKNLLKLNMEMIAVLEISIYTLEDEELIEKILTILLKVCKCVMVWHAQIEKNTKNKIYFLLKKFSDKRIIYMDLDYIFDKMRDQCTITDQYINDAGNAVICMKMVEGLQMFVKRIEKIER